VIDDVMFYRAVLRNQPQTQLVSHGVEYRRTIEQFRSKDFFRNIGWEFGRKCEGEVVAVFQARLVDYRALVLLQLLTEPPAPVLHGHSGPCELIIFAGNNGDLEILAAPVDLHLQPGLIDNERIHWTLFDFLVEFQLEAVGEQVLKHGVEIVDGRGMVDACFNVVAVVVKPFRAAFDLPHGHLVHQTDHEFYGNVLRRVAGSTRQRLDAAAAQAGLR